MKKIFSFVLSIALLGNIACCNITSAETDSKKVEKQPTRSTYTLVVTDPDTETSH